MEVPVKICAVCRLMNVYIIICTCSFPISFPYCINSMFCIQSKYLNLPSFVLYIIFSLSIRWKMVACVHLLWRLRIRPLQIWISEVFQDVNAIWPFPGGQLNHGHAKHFTLDCPSEGCFGFSLECLLGICSWQGKEGKLWTGKLSYNENYEHILHLSSPRVSLFCAEVLWNCSPQLHQGDQKSDQAHRRRDRSPPSSQKGMGLESVLCFRRTYGTRSTICWKGKLLMFGLLFLFGEILSWY